MVIAVEHSSLRHLDVVIFQVNAYTTLILLLHPQTTVPETIYLPG